MPELSEVEITRLKLLPLVRGRMVLDFWTDWPRGLKSADSVKLVVESVRGRKILDIERHGKVLIFKLSGKPERVMAIHLRMSGRLRAFDQNDEGGQSLRSQKTLSSRRKADSSFSSDSSLRWIHFRWKLSGDKEMHFIDPRKFGIVWYGSKDDFKRDPYLGNLGPDAKDITRETFHKVFHKARGAVKPFILKQNHIAGIGNIIADESLWHARIHPNVDVVRLSLKEKDTLLSAIRSTLAAMFSSGGTTLRDWGHPDGAKGSFQDYRKVYGRAGLPCPRCSTTFVRSIVGGRGTTFCPKCQAL